MLIRWLCVLLLSNLTAHIHAQGIRFDPVFPIGSGPNNTVFAMESLPDGRVWVGGNFTTYQGTSAVRLLRIFPNGQRDTSTNIGAGADSRINVMRLLPDGKVLIGGLFFLYNNQVSRGVARLLPDGNLDPGFQTGFGFNNEVLAIESLTDSGVLAAGFFSQFQQTPVPQPVKLFYNGQRDTTFNAGGTGTTGLIEVMLQQPDGRILIAGSVSAYNGQPVSKIFRIFPDGTRDTSFQTGSGFSTGSIRGMALQPDGKILAVGSFTSYRGVPRNRLLRLLQNGDLDTTFVPNVNFSTTVLHLRVLPDGRVLVFGNHAVPGSVLQHLAMLSSSGTLQPGGSSCSELNGGVNASVMLPDSSLLVGGNFSVAGGIPAPRLARVLVNLSGQSAGPPQVSAGTTLVCPLATVFLSAAGSLNGSQQWEWSTGGCGQTVVATGGPLIAVSPTVTTTYYVRGVGNCLAAGPCDSITIYVDTTAPMPAVDPLPVANLSCGATLAIPSANDSCAGTVFGQSNRPLVFTQPGTFQVVWTYTDAAGNSSQQSQQVQVDTLDTRLSVQGTVLTALNTGAQYRWLRCDQNFAVIPGAVAPFYTANQTGSYAVEIRLAGCSDTSACVQVTATGVPVLPEGWRLYPNPASEQMWLALPAGTHYVLNDVFGRRVLEGRSENELESVRLPNLAPGMYVWQLKSGHLRHYWPQQIR